MNLGKFSISLKVEDIDKSCQFYTALGFKIIDGGHVNTDFKDNDTMKWRFMENASVKIGLFQGMFKKNILTFHPTDLLKIQSELKTIGISFAREAKQNDQFKSAMLMDPDGNQIMLEQSENT
jgi:predicted lactoylglutathione lyase